jgi:hypothetical protein
MIAKTNPAAYTSCKTQNREHTNHDSEREEQNENLGPVRQTKGTLQNSGNLTRESFYALSQDPNKSTHDLTPKPLPKALRCVLNVADKLVYFLSKIRIH